MEAGSPGRWQRNRIIESNLKRRFSLVPLCTLKMRVTKERNPWPQPPSIRRRISSWTESSEKSEENYGGFDQIRNTVLSNMVTGSAAAERPIEVLVIIIL